jgi:hypothetical protein
MSSRSQDRRASHDARQAHRLLCNAARLLHSIADALENKLTMRDITDAAGER